MPEALLPLPELDFVCRLLPHTSVPDVCSIRGHILRKWEMSKTRGSAQIWRIWDTNVKAPSAEVLALQAALMKDAFTWTEKKKIPGLTLGFAQQRVAVKLAVGTASEIWSRINKCGKEDESGNKWECGVVFCPRCLMLRRGRQTAENLRLFAHLGNEKLAFMTVLVRVITDLGDARALQDKFALKIRNAISVERRADSKWNDVMVKGFWEFDHLSDTTKLGRNAKIALPQLGFQTLGIGQTQWLLHTHAIVALGDVSLDDFKEAVKRKGMDGPFQVDVQPFDGKKDVNENIKDITRYSMKFRIEDGYKRTGPFDPKYKFDMLASNKRKWWPKEAVASLTTHLSQRLHGYRSLQFWIGAKGQTKEKTGVRIKRRYKFNYERPARSPLAENLIKKLKEKQADRSGENGS